MLCQKSWDYHYTQYNAWGELWTKLKKEGVESHWIKWTYIKWQFHYKQFCKIEGTIN